MRTAKQIICLAKHHRNINTTEIEVFKYQKISQFLNSQFLRKTLDNVIFGKSDKINFWWKNLIGAQAPKAPTWIRHCNFVKSEKKIISNYKPTSYTVE